MRRGTTPTHVFTTDTDLTAATVLYLTYRQAGKVLIEKDLTEVAVEPEQVSVKLTQEDTLTFSTVGAVDIQIRAKFEDGTAIASNVMKAPAQEILKEGVI